MGRKATAVQREKMGENSSEIRRMRERLFASWERMESELNRLSRLTTSDDYEMSPAAVLQTQERAKNMLALAIREASAVLPPKHR